MYSSWVKSLFVITTLSAVLTLSGCGSSFTLPPGFGPPGSAPSPDGKVLVTGGFTNSTPVGSDTAEIYDPARASFLATNKPMVVGRWDHTATLLPDSTVLLPGGESFDSLVSETYSPSDGSFSAVGVVNSDPTGHSATLLKSGSVLIIQGTTAELYQ